MNVFLLQIHSFTVPIATSTMCSCFVRGLLQCCVHPVILLVCYLIMCTCFVFFVCLFVILSDYICSVWYLLITPYVYVSLFRIPELNTCLFFRLKMMDYPWTLFPVCVLTTVTNINYNKNNTLERRHTERDMTQHVKGAYLLLVSITFA